MTIAFLGLLLVVDPRSSLSFLEKGDEEFARIHYSLAEAMYDSVLATTNQKEPIVCRSRLFLAA